MNDKIPPVEIDVVRYEQESDENGNTLNFCIAKITIRKDSPDSFGLKLNRKEDERGIIFTPCKKFGRTVESRSEAIKLYTSNNKNTDWSVKFTHDCIEKGTEILFTFPGSSGVRHDVELEFAALIIDFKGFEFEYKDRINNQWSNILSRSDSAPQMVDSINSERFIWVDRKIKEIMKHNDASPPPLFHVKQQATIDAIKKLKNPKSSFTYVGPDDVANLISSLEEVSKATQQINEIHLRAQNEDSLSHTARLRQLLQETGNTESNERKIEFSDHNDSWEKSDIIIDTYTAMSWENKNHEQGIIAELKKRIDSLTEDGKLILVFPVKEEPFFVGSTTPNWLLENISPAVGEKLQDEGMKLIHCNILGNSKYAVLEKYKPNTSSDSKITVEKDLPQAIKDLDYETEKDSNQDPLYEDNFGKGEKHSGIQTKTTSMPKRVKNWDQYSRACRNKNPDSSPGRPFKLKIVEELRTTIQQINFDKNIIILQNQPGWGKTSVVGEALFPREAEDDYDDSRKIYFGSLEQHENFINSNINVREKESSILILDDLHNELSTLEGQVRTQDEIIQKVMKISCGIKVLILTCRNIEWSNSNLGRQIPDVAHVFSHKLWPDLMDDKTVQEFIFHLMDRAGCDPNSKKENVQKWAKHAQSKLFSYDNLILKSGAEFSPRWAIRFFQQSKQSDEDQTYDADEVDSDDEEFEVFYGM